MSQNDPTKIFFGVNLVPNSTSIVQNLGDLDVTVDGKLNFDNGTSASPVVTEAQPATLTNKTMDGNLNTFLNIPLTSIDSVAALKALQSDASGIISASSVSASELAELSGILSRAVGVSDTQTLTNKTINGSNNTITNVSLTTGVTGVLPEVNGGTGLSAVTTGDMLYASSANTLVNLTIGSNGQVLKVVSGIPTWSASNVTQNIRSVSTNTTLTTSDNIVLVDATSSSVSILLPSAASDAAVTLYIQKIDSSSHPVFIIANGSDTIQGVASIALLQQYQTTEIVSNGISNWTILSNSLTPDGTTLNLSASGALEVTPGGITTTQIATNTIQGTNLNSDVADGTTIELVSNALTVVPANVAYSSPLLGSLNSFSTVSIGTCTIDALDNRPLKVRIEGLNSSAEVCTSQAALTTSTTGNASMEVRTTFYDISNGNPYCTQQWSFGGSVAFAGTILNFAVPINGMQMTFPAGAVGTGSFTLGASITIVGASTATSISFTTSNYVLVMEQN